MSRCYHCGEEDRNCYYCQDCEKYYCYLHKEPRIHECSIVKEEPLITQQFNILHRQGQTSQFTVNDQRGRTDGCYTWYHPDTNVSEETLVQENKPETKLKEIKGTLGLIVLISLFSLIAMHPIIRACTNLSAYGLLKGYYWTLFTSFFVITIENGAALLTFFIGIFFIFKIAGDIEKTSGMKFFLLLYGFCGIFSSIIYLIFRFLISFSIPLFMLEMYSFSVGVSWASFLGVITYKVFLNPEGEWNLFISILPIKLKGKSLLLILIVLRLFSGIFYGYIHVLTLLMYCFELFGILAGYFVFLYKNKL